MNPRIKERLKKILPKLAYPAFYVFCLFVFLSWTFPYDKLKQRIVTTFNAQQRTSASPQELQIDELESSFVTGVKATGIRLIAPSSDPSKPASSIKIDDARARISLLGLLVGNKDISFTINAFEGTIKGTFDDNGKARAIDVTLDSIDVSKIDAIAANAGFPLDGKLFGTVKLDLPEGKASKGNGTTNLEIRDMFAGDAKELTVKTPLGPFTLPRLKVGALTVTGEAKDGVLKISKIAASGGDVDVSGDGRVQMREVATDAMLDVNIKFKVNDAYRNKNDKTKMLFGAPGGKEKPMLEMSPDMAKSKTSDGYYAMRVTGTLGNPSPKAAGGGVPANPFGGSGTGGSGGLNFK